MAGAATMYPECQNPEFKGPPMVRRDWPSGEGYCIDTREVTRADYQEFLASGPSVEEQPTACLDNLTLYNSCTQEDDLDTPCGGVNWCSAYGYCAWAGKRLCQITDVGRDEYDDPIPLAGEWLNACSAQGTRAFSYGDEFDETRCAAGDSQGTPLPPKPSCVDVEGEILGLSNNTREWVGPCLAEDGASTGLFACYSRGGSPHPFEVEGQLPGQCSGYFRRARLDGERAIGFRCCTDIH